MMIKKATRIAGKTLVFRDVTVDDSDFILSLRLDFSKSKYLSPTSSDMSLQKKWLLDYENSTNQAYFVIEHSNQSIGVVRLYDARDSSFCWGSWILASNAPTHAAIESALIIYSYAINYLGFANSHFDVRKENDNVWRFHERFGAIRISEDDINYFYEIHKDSIKKSLQKYRKFLTEIEVEPK
jgi:hypothetical protein